MSLLSAFDNTSDWLEDDLETTLDDTSYSLELASRIGEEEAAKNVKTILKAMENWSKMGLSTSRREKRLKVLAEFLDSCREEIEQIEEQSLQNLCLRRTRLLGEIQKMLADLHLPPYEPDDNLTLLQIVKFLKQKHKELDLVKQERLDRLEDLKNRLTAHCKLLDIQVKPVNLQTDIPSETELMNLQTAVSDMEKETKRRRDKLACLRDMISTLMGQLEWQPQNDFERHVLQDQPNKFTHHPLSEEHLKKMQVFHKQLEDQYAENQKEFEQFDATLKALYSRLDIPEAEQRLFLSTHFDCKPSILKEMKEEIAKYELLKKQNIGIFIEKIRAELSMEYDKCFLAQNERPQFTLATSDETDFSEEMLERHERELERIRAYFDENKQILEKFQKWQEMWLKLIDFETKANDPNRFNNRGGQLLQEERQRKALQKGLPKVEAELTDLCAKWEQANPGKKFRIFDSNLDAFIAGCWAELHEAKESEKRERLRVRNNVSSCRGSQRGKKPVLALQQSSIVTKRTPVKRIAGMMITPTPTKVQCRGATTSSSHNSRSTVKGAGSSAKKGLAPTMSNAKNGLPNTFINNSLSLNEEQFENAIQSCHTSGRR